MIKYSLISHISEEVFIKLHNVANYVNIMYFTALKSIVGEVIQTGYEPYSEFRPYEEVSSLIGPSAILKRQVPSIILTVLGNKVIVELKRKLKEIYESQ